MKMLFKITVIFAALVLPLFPMKLRAEAPDAPQIAKSKEDVEKEAIKEQMEDMERRHKEEMQDMRQRLEALETKKVEEDEDAWYKKIEAGYKKPGDGFTLKTKDGNFSMKFRLRSQVQFSILDEEDELTETNFRIRRLRLKWEGNAFRPWFLYEIQVDAVDDIILRDAYFDVAYNKMFAPRTGQYKVPFSREELNSSSELQFVERSIINDEFAFGRDRGAGVYGVIGNYIVYGAGIFNGDGRNGTSTDSNLLYAGRVQFTLCCGELQYKQGQFPTGGDYNMEPNFGKKDKALIALSAAIAGIPGLNIGRKTPDNAIDDRFDEIFGGDVIDAGGAEADVIAFTADANFRYWVFSLEGEYHLRNIEPEDGAFQDVTDQGFRVAGGIFLVPDFIEAAARFAYIDFDDDIDGRESRLEITPGFNIYLSRSHKWKLQLSYSFINEEDTDGEEVDQNIFRAQLQGYF